MTLHYGAAAHAIASIRPEWDTAGIARALEATKGSPADVLAAAALAAGDAKLRLPSPAAFLNHWPKNATAEPWVSHNVPCPDHPTEHDMPCPVPPEPVDPEWIAALKAELQKAIDARRPAPKRPRPTPAAHDLEQVRAHADKETK